VTPAEEVRRRHKKEGIHHLSLDEKQWVGVFTFASQLGSHPSQVLTNLTVSLFLHVATRACCVR
jgi:hypothetical protein